MEGPQTAGPEMRMPMTQVENDSAAVASTPSSQSEERGLLRFARAVKYSLDFFCALAMVILLSPLLLLIALCVKLDDGGPVLYRRRVVGRKGEFDAFKFRTMRTDADAVLAANPAMREKFERSFKLKNDPRVTRVGALLRKYSLDEFPQLFNVLKGEMSLVGPRMITAAELRKYGEFGQRLLQVKPGLTGYWQVNGRQRVSYEERVKMDIYYLDNWSLGLDLEILLRTPVKVLRGEGAY
jgi:lipopolysaccharide/colanic/teichoic acid biosynthesis glycosyltransferase